MRQSELQGAYVRGRIKSFAQGNQGILSAYVEKVEAEAVALYPADAAPSRGDGGLRDFEAGRVKVDMDGPYKGWVSVRHADGQWVTAVKLEPFSMAILSQPLSSSPRKEGE